MAYRPSWRFTPGQQFGGGDNFAQDFGIMPGTPGDVTYGQIKRGPAPPQYRFQPPRAGVQADFRAPASGPLIDNRAPAGTFTNLIRQSADNYVDYKTDQKATALRKGMKLARANNNVARMRGARALGLPPSLGTPAGGGGLLPPPGGTPPPPPGPPFPPGPLTPPSPPPSGGGGTPSTFSPPPGSTGATPSGGGTTPPSPPKRGPRTTPFGVPPMSETGADLITAMTRTTPDIEESPARTEWRDEPENPFPKGTFEPFDSSRMFDPDYKAPSSSPRPITSPATSRAQRRPRK